MGCASALRAEAPGEAAPGERRRADAYRGGGGGPGAAADAAEPLGGAEKEKSASGEPSGTAPTTNRSGSRRRRRSSSKRGGSRSGAASPCGGDADGSDDTDSSSSGEHIDRIEQAVNRMTCRSAGSPGFGPESLCGVETLTVGSPADPSPHLSPRDGSIASPTYGGRCRVSVIASPRDDSDAPTVTLSTAPLGSWVQPCQRTPAAAVTTPHGDDADVGWPPVSPRDDGAAPPPPSGVLVISQHGSPCPPAPRDGEERRVSVFAQSASPDHSVVAVAPPSPSPGSAPGLPSPLHSGMPTRCWAPAGSPSGAQNTQPSLMCSSRDFHYGDDGMERSLTDPRDGRDPASRYHQARGSINPRKSLDASAVHDLSGSQNLLAIPGARPRANSTASSRRGTCDLDNSLLHPLSPRHGFVSPRAGGGKGSRRRSSARSIASMSECSHDSPSYESSAGLEWMYELQERLEKQRAMAWMLGNGADRELQRYYVGKLLRNAMTKKLKRRERRQEQRRQRRASRRHDKSIVMPGPPQLAPSPAASPAESPPLPARPPAGLPLLPAPYDAGGAAAGASIRIHPSPPAAAPA